jgi:hypothetical protein
LIEDGGIDDRRIDNSDVPRFGDRWSAALVAALAQYEAYLTADTAVLIANGDLVVSAAVNDLPTNSLTYVRVLTVDPSKLGRASISAHSLRSRRRRWVIGSDTPSANVVGVALHKFAGPVSAPVDVAWLQCLGVSSLLFSGGGAAAPR